VIVPRTLETTAARILIVDDHDIFRSRARRLLEVAGYDVVGEAADAASAIAETRRLRPDIVLLDVQLPDADGFAVLEELAAEPYMTRVVLVSSRQAIDYGSRLDLPAAAGFIHKPDLSRASLERLIDAAR
jgi:DNA-binding NarL/FixJ family response regulator